MQMAAIYIGLCARHERAGTPFVGTHLVARDTPRERISTISFLGGAAPQFSLGAPKSGGAKRCFYVRSAHTLSAVVGVMRRPAIVSCHARASPTRPRPGLRCSGPANPTQCTTIGGIIALLRSTCSMQKCIEQKKRKGR